MGAGASPRMAASTLAARVREFETPEAVLRARLALAAQVTEEVRGTEPVVAALVVGSTALRRCSVRADLDLVLVTASPDGQDRFVSRAIDGVRVEIELLDRRRALACTTGEGWVWELREAARLGCGVPVFETGGFAARLARRASAMRPSPDRIDTTLRDIYLLLIGAGRREGDPSRRMDALRGCLDNLALLALLERPRRYQKAKWALADLLHAGDDALVEAILAAYGIGSDDPAPARDATVGARDLIERAYALVSVPPHDTILAMGYAPELAEPSYVSRCLDDAEDLEATGRFVEAQYVAKFAARLAGGMLSPEVPAASIVDTFAACDGGNLARRYLDLFAGEPEPACDLMEAALAAADARREALDSRPEASRALLA